MAITPQAIKDQEFQSKFRGYDTIEVKAYLELVAEEFFELLEKMRQQEDDITVLIQEKNLLEELKANLETDIEAALRTSDGLRAEMAEKDEKFTELSKEIDELQTAHADFELERKEFEEEVQMTENMASEIEERLKESDRDKETLRKKIESLQEQSQETRDDEIDLKRTLGAAQRFADDLRKQAQEEADTMLQESESKAQELLEKSEEKASTALQMARDEIERLRRGAYDELSRLPEEIERLSEQRNEIREDLRAVLASHLEKLDVFTEVDESVKHYDYDELFQKINIPDEIDERIDELEESNKNSAEFEDQVFEEDSEEMEENPPPKEGDVAFLSDN
jgi:DivIVA domain-containing protein